MVDVYGHDQWLEHETAAGWRRDVALEEYVNDAEVLVDDNDTWTFFVPISSEDPHGSLRLVVRDARGCEIRSAAFAWRQ